jgi:predicted alpha/beta-fold hydrolase
MGVVHEIAVTSLVLNAEDDPITVIENKDDWPGLCEQMADACMLRLPMGGHVGFFEQGTSWKPRSWAFGLAAAFVAAARDEKPSLRAGERKGRQRSSPSRRKTA